MISEEVEEVETQHPILNHTLVTLHRCRSQTFRPDDDYPHQKPVLRCPSAPRPRRATKAPTPANHRNHKSWAGSSHSIVCPGRKTRHPHYRHRHVHLPWWTTVSTDTIVTHWKLPVDPPTKRPRLKGIRQRRCDSSETLISSPMAVTRKLRGKTSEWERWKTTRDLIETHVILLSLGHVNHWPPKRHSPRVLTIWTRSIIMASMVAHQQPVNVSARRGIRALRYSTWTRQIGRMVVTQMDDT